VTSPAKLAFTSQSKSMPTGQTYPLLYLTSALSNNFT